MSNTRFQRASLFLRERSGQVYCMVFFTLLHVFNEWVCVNNHLCTTKFYSLFLDIHWLHISESVVPSSGLYCSVSPHFMLSVWYVWSAVHALEILRVLRIFEGCTVYTPAVCITPAHDQIHRTHWTVAATHFISQQSESSSLACVAWGYYNNLQT